VTCSEVNETCDRYDHFYHKLKRIRKINQFLLSIAVVFLHTFISRDVQ